MVGLSFLGALAPGVLFAQEARVRSVPRLEMPAHVDSNSPAFWRDNRLFWFGSTGRVLLNEGADLDGPWESREVIFNNGYPAPHWLEAIWVDDDGTLWGWYHCEPIGLVPGSTLTAPKIGAAMSTDGGKSFFDFGIIMESGDPIDETAQNGYFGGGHGDFSVVLNEERTFFYFFFGNYGGPAEKQGVAVARMAFSDRFNPTGRIWKFNDGRWEEAGMGGRLTPIFPVRRSWQFKDPDAFWGPSVHWNTFLKCYVMLLSHAKGEPGWSQEGVYVSFCSDLTRPETWTDPKRIIDPSQIPTWYYFYPQVMGLEAGGTDTRAGQVARLYVNGVSKWEIEFVPPAAPEETVTPINPITPTDPVKPTEPITQPELRLYPEP